MLRPSLRENGYEAEHEAPWVIYDLLRATATTKVLQQERDEISLNDRQGDGCITRPLINLLSTLLPFLVQSIKGGNYDRHQLEDNRRRDIRHNTQSKNA